tara:strand:- start:59 stop:343 length:285 start_codon:yes stop_codon:yes gene_type:complete
MEYSKNNELLINFLVENKRYWSFEDFKMAFKTFSVDMNTRTLNTLKYNLIQGNISNGQISKYKKPILDLCKIVTKKLDDEQEILASIKNYQAVS